MGAGLAGSPASSGGVDGKCSMPVAMTTRRAQAVSPVARLTSNPSPAGVTAVTRVSSRPGTSSAANHRPYSMKVSSGTGRP